MSDQFCKTCGAPNCGSLGTSAVCTNRLRCFPLSVLPDDWGDTPLPEDAAIDAAFPTRSGRHDLYAEAMRLVGARRSKSGLVALVNWLLHRAETPRLHTEQVVPLLVDGQNAPLTDAKVRR